MVKTLSDVPRKCPIFRVKPPPRSISIPLRRQLHTSSQTSSGREQALARARAVKRDRRVLAGRSSTKGHGTSANVACLAQMRLRCCCCSAVATAPRPQIRPPQGQRQCWQSLVHGDDPCPGPCSHPWLCVCATPRRSLLRPLLPWFCVLCCRGVAGAAIVGS